MSAQDRDIVTHVSGNAIVIYLIRPSLIFEDDISRVSDAFTEAIDASKNPDVVLEFSAVTQVASAFIGKLLILDRHLKETGRRLVLCAMRKEVMGVFKLLNLHKLFKIVKDEYVALHEE